MDIYVIKTDKGCFITDVLKFDGYDYTYHRSDLKTMFFDGEKPNSSFFQTGCTLRGIHKR